MSSAGVAVGVLMASFLVWLWLYAPRQAEDEVAEWLERQGLPHLRSYRPFNSMSSLEELAELDLAALPDSLQWSTSLPVLQEGLELLELQLWLRREGAEQLLPLLVQAGHTSMHTLLALNPQEVELLANRLSPGELGQKFGRKLIEDISTSLESPKSMSALKFILILIISFLLVAAAVVIGLALCFCCVFLSGANNIPTANHQTQNNPYDTSSEDQELENEVVAMRRRARRRRLAEREDDFSFWAVDPDLCWLEWSHEDNVTIGTPSVVALHLVSRDSAPYQLSSSDTLTVTVRHSATRNVVPHVVEPAPPTNQSKLRLLFTARLAGTYSLHISLNGRSLAHTPVNRTFLPGPVDPAKTSFLEQPQWLVLTAGLYHSMTVAPRDCFGNPAIIQQEHLSADIRRGGLEGALVNPECVVERVPNTSHFELLLKVESAGYFIASVLYKGQKIGPPQFTIISLSPSEAAIVERSLHRRSINLYYEASVVSGDKHKKVYCYLYPKQVQVKEFYLKIFPSHLYTCKICPTTNIRLHVEEGVFTIDDGYQPPITLWAKQREVIAATFYNYLLKNIGGSEQFKDKRKFFYSELSKLHRKESRGDKHLSIDRFNLLSSAMRETKGFSASEWHKTFTVTFIGEEALDWGGVSREFFHLLCTQCFNCSNGMFRRFKDDPQALVHPNPHHPPTVTPHHYQFAGRLVGKCLLESSLGNNLLVSARFSRSFLAQLIGLRINYKYFESDDPELYTSKVQYIRENDVCDLELVFAEEEFSDDGTAEVVPLVEGGEEKMVTEENKTHYLNLLAQHRLATQCRSEVEHFMKGLNALVPENLLSIFDENELELLMCGTETVSYEDLKRHAVVATGNPTFHRVVSWFWVVVSDFTREEMARLLQFVSGSSQLPPGGFKELSPKFQITSAPTHGRLPSAHTCFNQLCLPEYDSCEQFQTALMLALNEGTEGFGFL